MPESGEGFLRGPYQDYLYKLLVEAAVGFAIFTVDTKGEVATWNSGAKRLLGYEENEILGKEISIIFTPEDRAAGMDRKELQTAEKTGQAEDERWHVRKDGSRFYGSGLVFPLKSPEGKLEGFVKILRDYTERELAKDYLKQAKQELERRLKEETARREVEEALGHALADFHMLMDSITDYAIILLDNKGKIVDWNQGAKNILQYQRDEVIGCSLDFIFTPEDLQNNLLQDELQRAINDGRSVDDVWLIRKNGERLFAMCLVQPLFDKSGQLRGFAKIMRDMTERKLAEEETKYLASHDQLTGLPNRTAFSSRLHYELARAKRYKMTLAVLLLDLNKFKYINDTLGHDAGDLLLQEVSRRLTGSVREIDMVARIGGDEFVIIETGLRKVEDAGLLAQKIIKELAQPFYLNETEVYSGASIGISVYPKDAGDTSQLLKNADIAMYHAKSLKQDGYEYFTDVMGAQVEARKQIEDRLRISLDKEELEIHYQPQIDLTNWQITAAEALLRWKSPDMQSIPVADLFHIAEESGAIVQLGKWVLQAVCRQMALWRESGLPAFQVAINVSPMQFTGPDFLETVNKAFDEYGIQPGWLEMEITERALVEKTADSIAVLEQLKAMGVLISIDDFGVGYAALSYLRNFPVDIVKIDLSLIKHLPSNQDDVAIVSGILELAQNLGFKVIAEGVETTEQLAFLKAHNCTGAQGYLFHPPVPADEFAELVMQSDWSHLKSTGFVQ